MLYLLDTNAVTDLMNGEPVVLVHLSKTAAPDRAVVCSIVRGEVLFGIERLSPGKRRNELRASAQAVLGYLACEAVPESAGDEYARLKRLRQSAGMPMDENDLWIAATALALKAVLVTRDGDFRKVPGLRVEDWTTS